MVNAVVVVVDHWKQQPQQKGPLGKAPLPVCLSLSLSVFELGVLGKHIVTV